MPRYVIELRRGDRGEWQASGNNHSVTNRRLSVTEFNSLAEAEAEAEAQQRRSIGGNRYRARDTQPELGEPRGGTYYMEPASVEQVTKVRIYRRNNAWVIDSAGRSRPTMSLLRNYIPQTARPSAAGYYSVEDALGGGMNPQMLAGALSAWFTEHPNTEGQVRVSEGQAELPDNMAYLALGDHVYRMIAVRQVNTSKANVAMREKLKHEMESLRAGLMRQAGGEASQLITAAQDRARRIEQEVELKRAELRAGLHFPEWLRNYPVKSRNTLEGELVYCMLETAFVFTSVSHGANTWPISPMIRATVDVWYPLNGKPEMAHQMTARDGYLPHMNVGSACIKIGETVREIKDMPSLTRFRDQVVRAFQVINLASLLNPHHEQWIPEIYNGLPAAIKTWLVNHTSMDDQRPGTGLPIATQIERSEETWNIPAIR